MHARVKDEEFDDPLEHHKRAIDRLALFCDQTTMHGMAFLISKNNPDSMKRIIWVAVVVSAYGAIIIFMHQAISDFLTGVTSTSISFPPLGLANVTFPAITLCNNNQQRKSFDLIDYFDKTSTWFNMQSFVYHGHQPGTLTDQELKELEMILRDNELIVNGLRHEHYRDNYESNPFAWTPTTKDIVVEKSSSDSLNGSHFRTFSAINPDNSHVLGVCHKRQWIDGINTTLFRPYMHSEYGYDSLCTLIKPHQALNDSETSWTDKVLNGHQPKGVKVGKDMGLTVILDAEVILL